MGAEHSFSVGDRVQVTNRGDGKVTYGPVGGALSGVTVVVVLLDSGDEVAVNVLNVWPYAAKPYVVGDKVKHTHFGDGEIVFGPFKYGADDDACLMLDARGDHRHVTPEYLTLMAPAAAPNTYVHDGVAYDLSAKYRDRDGDMWEFTGVDHESDGTPEVVCPHSEITNLSDVLDSYGPLTKEG